MISLGSCFVHHTDKKVQSWATVSVSVAYETTPVRGVDISSAIVASSLMFKFL